jgi:hypothetical protein
VGFGTAFANGSLILVDTFDPPELRSSMSDTLVFPEPNSSTKNANTKDSKGSSSSSDSSSKAPSKPNAGAASAAVPEPAAAGASVTSFAEASAAPARVRPTLLPKDAQRELQPAYRRRFESYMHANGYNVRSTRRGMFVSPQTPQQIAQIQQQQKQQAQAAQNAQTALRFSSTDASAAAEGVAAAMPAGVESAPEQMLVCVACRGNMVSIGGLIGGSFCMPCELGTQPDATRSSCGEQMIHLKSFLMCVQPPS